MGKFSGCFIGILMLVAGSALAAEDEFSSTLTDMQGNVLVNQGQEYKKATLKQRFKDGDLVLVKENEWFEIAYDKGCDEKVEGPIIYTVDTGACGAALWFGSSAAINATSAAAVATWGGGLVVCGALCGDGGDGRDNPVSP